MKRLYIIITSLLICAVSLAQISNSNFPELSDVSTKTLKSDKIISSYMSKSTPFWTEDFSGGIPSGWTNSTTVIPPVLSAPWVYRGPNTNPNISVGSQGAYAGTNGPIASPTASNGFMIFDSDFYDNGGTPGAFGSGQYPCNSITGGAPTGHVGTLTTDSIDCSMYNDISILFNSFYREYTGIAKIAFSIDGGITFTDTVEVHPEIEVNERTENDYQVMVRMPLNIAGNSDVRIQFIYDGTVLYNVSYNGYYFWMIDDIQLIETPPHMINITDANYGGWNTTPFSEGFGLDYTYMPLSQSASNPYSFEATIANSGASSQTNVVLNATVHDYLGNQVYSGTSSPFTLQVMDTLILTTDVDFSPSSLGVYDFSFWVSSDSIAATDTTNMVSVATDSVYGRDYNNEDGTWRVGRSCGGLQLGNIFDVFEGDYLTSVSAFVAGYSVPGASMYGALYEVDTSGGTLEFIYLDQTDDYTITPSDTNNWVHIGFNGGLGVELYSGQYMIAIGGYANPVDTFGISTSGNAPVSMSRIQDNGCNLGSQPFGFWYWINNTPMIRMNFGTTPLSINDNIFSGKLTVYPNPSSGKFILDLINVSPGLYTINVTDIFGKNIYFNEEKIVTNSTYELDLNAFGKGIYILNIQNGDHTINKKLIVE
tara:strand:+ start:15140 stop:17092 length:1953 start_codon:yes stop_codon:yes gene_type:complete